MLTPKIETRHPTPAEVKLLVDSSYVEENEVATYVPVQWVHNGKVVSPTFKQLYPWGLERSTTSSAAYSNYPPHIIGPSEDAWDAPEDLRMVGLPKVNPTVFWMDPRFVPWLKKQATKASKAAKQSVLPEKIQAMLRAHISDGQILTTTQAAQLIKLRPTHADLLVVPAKYTKAYRILTSLPSLDFLGLASPAAHGAAQGGTYQPKGKNVGCWSVSAAVFQDKNFLGMGDVMQPATKGQPVRYGVLMVAKLGPQRDSFLLNPDTLPQALMDAHFQLEKEVLSLGPIALQGFVYFSQGHSTAELSRNYRAALSLLP